MKTTDKKKKITLFVCNIVLILATIFFAWGYSRHISRSQEENKRSEFIRTIESMKSVSQNYLNGELGYVKDWSVYISQKDMTLEESLDFLRKINTNKERFIHIVDMDSYEAYSSYYPKGKEKIDTYVKYKTKESKEELPFGEIMESMFQGKDKQFRVLGKYRLKETQAMAVGIGTRVTLHTKYGKKAYLMLRIIPVDVLKESWIFPTEYANAEVGVITHTGDYVVQSASMRSQNFIEYIRGYNFQKDYNKGEQLKKTLKQNDHGTLEYKNFKGTDCIWYYSSFGKNSALDILGVLDKKIIKASVDTWYIVFMVCGILVLLMVIDGAYLISINSRLRETVRLSEQASKAKTQFLSAMSHDIRTPLNVVLGMMTLVRNKADDAAYVAECMEKGLQSGKHLLTLINDVLDISKIESGNVSLHAEQVSLVEFIQDLLEMQKQNVEEKSLVLKTILKPLPYPYVLADKMRLNQIYVNLLTNAIKYSRSQGEICLHLYEESIPDDTGNIRVVFCLKDHGIGMSKAFQENMYHNFTREISTQVNNIQGTGLGLSIVKSMVDMMGGTIECDSAPGMGTAFKVCIDLPIVQNVQKSVPDKKRSNSVEGLHLLVAEDNELNWEIFRRLVMAWGVQCDHARNGKECVQMLKDAPAGTYSAIMMDINMPVMSGNEAAKEIRSLLNPALCRIPIIAMTADAFAEDVKASMDCGMNGHIAKPLETDLLYLCLEKIKNKTL